MRGVVAGDDSAPDPTYVPPRQCPCREVDGMERHRSQVRGSMMVCAGMALIAAACTNAPAATTPTSASPATASSGSSPSPSQVEASAAPTETPGPTAAPERDPAAYVEGTTYAVSIDPSDFVTDIDNPYWPLVPGTTTIFTGGGERIVVEVTDYAKSIMGVPATVVRDRAYSKGKLIEDTFDWYAQDRQGNVWYMGEDTTEFEAGKPVSTAGSWQAGVDGALPGIVMLADPQPGDVYRNEYYPGEAEDLSKVLQVGGTITVPAGAYTATILTEDWTPLEPDQLEHKTYAPGVGIVAEGPVDDPTESTLVEIRQP